MVNKKNNTLLNNTISLYMMNIVKLIFPLLTLPYLTRILSTEAYGIVTYVKALIVYVQLIIDFGFVLSATKKIVYADNDKKEIGRITGDTLAEKGILSIFTVVIFVIVTLYIPMLKQNRIFCILYLVSVLLTVFIFDFLFRGLEKMYLVAIPYVAAKTITTFMTFLVIRSDKEILLIPLLEIVGNLIASIISLYFMKKIGIILSFSSPSKWFNDLKESSLYFISNFATTIFGALMTVIAGFHISMSNIAFWGISMQILSAAKALYNPITNSIYPHMIKSKDLKLIKKIELLMTIPITIGTLIVIFASENIMRIIGGDKYMAAGNLLRILLPAFIFSFYSMLYGWPTLGAIGKIKETTATTIIASIVQILGLLVLIVSDSFNLYGLAVSCSISEVTLFIARYYVYFKNKNLFIKNFEV